MDISTIISTVISVVITISVSWYWATHDRRSLKAAQKLQNKAKTLDEYTKGTGYKIIIRDCFNCLTYCLAIVFIPLGASIFILTIFDHPALRQFLTQITSSAILASGLILFDMFLILSKTYNPKKYKEELLNKASKLKGDDK